jgi:putative addiction module killer protein
MEISIEFYETEKGRIPFIEWLESFKDETAKNLILARIQRLRLGLWGKWRIISRNIFEVKVNYGPGYRVYYGKKGDNFILLLVGGMKRSQNRDIKLAKQYWSDFLKRTKNA